MGEDEIGSLSCGDRAEGKSAEMARLMQMDMQSWNTNNTARWQSEVVSMREIVEAHE